MIVWLASYPRSGNTFLRVLVKACFGLDSYSQYNDTQDIGNDTDLANVVGHKMYDKDWESFYKTASKSKKLTLVKTHGRPLDDARSIYLVRDPRACLVSYHNYIQNFTKLDTDRVDTILGATAFGDWGGHVRSWLPGTRKQTLLLKFEELTSDPVAAAEAIREFLDLGKSGKKIPSFEELQRVSPRFFHKGSNKQNIATLTDEEDNLIRFMFGDEMKETGYPLGKGADPGMTRHLLQTVSPRIYKAAGAAAALASERERISGLHKKVAEGEARADFNKKRLEEAKADLQGVRKQATEAEARADFNKKRIEELRAELQGMTKTSAAAASEKKISEQLQGELNDLKKQLKDAETRVEADKSRIASLQSEQQALNKQAKDAEGRADFNKKRTEELKIELQGLRERAKDADARAEINQQRLESMQTELEGTRKQLEKKGQELEAIRGKNAQLEALVESRQAEAVELKARLDSLEEDLIAKTRSVLELETSQAALEKASATLADDLKKTEATVKRRDKSLQAARESLTDAKAEATHARRALDVLNTNLTEERALSARTQGLLAELTAQKVERERHIDQIETEIARLREQLDRQTKRAGDLQAENKAARERLVEVHRAVEPRLKPLLTLRPARFILQQRALIKEGKLHLDDEGVPLIPGQDLPEPADLENTPSRSRPVLVEGAGHSSSIYADYKVTKPLGIAVYAFDRASNVEHVLESLLLQGALEHTHVFIDGDQGNPKKRAMIDETERVVAGFPVCQVHRNRGNFGFRKMMIVSMRKMLETYDRVLFLEDDCFPTRFALKGFSMELDRVENDPSVMSVYGHPFLTESEEAGPIARFQGWGWATTRKKLKPLWKPLLDLYLLSEEEYLEHMKENLTEELTQRLDVTPGRQPTSTLPRFFAWDEVLGYLAARAGKTHKRTEERLIYNFGVGASSTHFNRIDHYRKPPFNMVTMEEIWSYF